MDRIHHHAHMHHHSRRERNNMEIRWDASPTALTERSRVQLVPRSTCTNDSDPGCVKPTQVPALPVVLAVVVPIVIAAAVLLFLHRRHVKKLKEEDAKDKYKSLDFGTGPATAKGKKGKRLPEMALADTQKSVRHGRGLSLDVGSPYILPAGLHGSRESFHSLSRSTNDPHDPYRPVTFLKDDASMRSNSRNAKYRHDNGSVYTMSSTGTDQDRMNNGLLKNAQRMSQSLPPRGESMSPPERSIPEIKFPEPVAIPLSPLNPKSATLPPPPPPPVAPSQTNKLDPVPAKVQAPAKSEKGPPVVKPMSSIAPFALGKAASTLPTDMLDVSQSAAPSKTSPAPPPYPRIQSQEAVVHSNPNTNSFMSDSSYGDGFNVIPPSPTEDQHQQLAQQGPLAPQPLRPQLDQQQHTGLGIEDPGFNANRLSMSLRPLPPDDPNDNPEQRANRIRSFYKEYFDDTKPDPAGGHMYNSYQEDYGSEYLDGAVFDPQSGAFVVAQPHAPFAQPVTRRAMTPPPRAPPRFRSGSNPRGPHMSNGSMSSSGRYMPPRGMSSMSGRLPAPGPKRPVVPPTPLASLPTPAKLKDDAMVFNAIDFAPPVSFRDRQNGMRPDSPLGSPRPFSPSIRPHTPLASSYDDLAVMPSPHMLRKSGTFTALDFAPPPRFRDPGSNASDAGSIRSNRSGMSQASRMAVRNGAYRVSRIPKEVVGTKDDIFTSLRPQMNMVSKA